MSMPIRLSLSWESLRMLLEARAKTCVTIVVPTAKPPAGAGDGVVLRHLIDRVGRTLAPTRSRIEVESLLAPWRSLENDPCLSNHGGTGLACFGTEGDSWIVPLDGPVSPAATVGPRFQTLILLEKLAAIERCRVVVVSSRSMRVFDGVGDGEGTTRLLPVALSGGPGRTYADGRLFRGQFVDAEPREPHRVMHGTGPSGVSVHGGFGSRAEGTAADTRRFFHDVAGILAAAGSPPSCGYLLVGLPGQVAEFAEAMAPSAGPHARMSIHPRFVGEVELAHVVGDLLRAARRRRETALVATFQEARVHGRGTGDFAEVARAAVAGRVGVLMVEIGRREAGWIDSVSGAIDFPAEPAVDDGDDLYGALAVTVLKRCGVVACLPAGRMPTRTGVAAIFRWGETAQVRGHADGRSKEHDRR